MKVLGIMSGTSVDSVDYVVCTFGRAGAISFEKDWSVSFPRTLRQRLHAAASNRATAHEVGQLQELQAGVDLGVRPTFADVGQTLADAFRLAPLAHGASFLSSIYRADSRRA